MDNLALLLLCMALSLVAGSNDGSTLIALNLTNKAIGPFASIALLACVIALEPFVLGTAVATTVAHGLVSFEGQMGVKDVLIAVLVTLGVILALGRVGLPTSLTLALVGSIVGVGLATGRAVAWPTVRSAILVGVGAPLVSVLVGWFVARWLGYVPWRTDVRRQTRVLHGAAFLLQAMAYAANDAQKLFAVAALATGGAIGAVRVLPATQIAIAAMFSLGILVGIRRYAGRLTDRIVPVRETHSIAAKLGASVSVMASSALGLPVSMTQSSTAGLVGAGMSDSITRVRWPHTVPIMGAWLVTLPAATIVAIVVVAAVQAVR